MKNYFTLLFLLFFSFSICGQSEWAEVGMRWWYHTTDEPSGAYSMTFEYEVLGETMVGGQLCKVITRQGFQIDTTYSYEEGGQVFFWNMEDSVFTLRYDWNKAQGESYDCSTAGTYGQSLNCHVDTVFTMEIQGQEFQHQRVTIEETTFFGVNNEHVIKYIGGNRLFDARYVSELQTHIDNYLLCFESPTYGLNTVTEVEGTNCFNLANPVFEKDGKMYEINISPNPTSGPTKINYALPSPTSEIIITNSIGQINSRYFLEHMEGELTIGNLPAGLYFITLMAEGKIVGTERLVVY